MQISTLEGFNSLEQSRNLEVIPTLTAASFKKRDPEIGEWEHDNDPQRVWT